MMKVLNSLSKNVVDFLSTKATKSTNFSIRYALIHPEVMDTKSSAGLLGKVLSSLSCRKSLQNDNFLHFNFCDLQRFSGLWQHSQLKLNRSRIRIMLPKKTLSPSASGIRLLNCRFQVFRTPQCHQVYK